MQYLPIGKKDYINELRGTILRDIGGIISPLNAWLLVRGLKTLAVRMERHQENALEIAKYLNDYIDFRSKYMIECSQRGDDIGSIDIMNDLIFRFPFKNRKVFTLYE